MSNVALTIGGRRYVVACAAGEEAHLEMLGQLVDQKLRNLGNMPGQSEPQSLLYAALLLADESADLQARSRSADEAVAETLEIVAEKLELLAARLEISGNKP